jgi:hypothetical protein
MSTFGKSTKHSCCMCIYTQHPVRFEWKMASGYNNNQPTNSRRLLILNLATVARSVVVATTQTKLFALCVCVCAYNYNSTGLAHCAAMAVVELVDRVPNKIQHISTLSPEGLFFKQTNSQL